VTDHDVSVVVGAGGIGAACAAELHRFGGTLVLADAALGCADDIANGLRDRFEVVRAVRVDITSDESVRQLASLAASLGTVKRVVHAAGVSPEQGGVDAIVAVDLVGTAHVIDAFGDVIGRAGAGVVIASVAGHIFAPFITADQARALGAATPAQLAELTLFDDLETAVAYGYAKRGNQLRVRTAAKRWARRGARINSVSPGVVDTQMGRTERSGTAGQAIEELIANSPIARAARPAEIASVVGFLLSESAGFVTGTDLVVDGGALVNFS
jgi:NAD(P)-dependent dehydrogenase (short-subunit alcohol dehydrogenase family)